MAISPESPYRPEKAGVLGFRCFSPRVKRYNGTNLSDPYSSPGGSRCVMTTTPSKTVLRMSGVEIGIVSEGDTDNIALYSNMIPSIGNRMDIDTEVDAVIGGAHGTQLLHPYPSRVFQHRVDFKLLTRCQERGRPTLRQKDVMESSAAHYLQALDPALYKRLVFFNQDIQFEWLHVIACMFNLDPQRIENLVVGSWVANRIMATGEMAIKNLIIEGMIPYADITVQIKYRPYGSGWYSSIADEIIYLISSIDKNRELKTVKVRFDSFEHVRATHGTNKLLKEIIKSCFCASGAVAVDDFKPRAVRKLFS